MTDGSGVHCSTIAVLALPTASRWFWKWSQTSASVYYVASFDLWEAEVKRCSWSFQLVELNAGEFETNSLKYINETLLKLVS